MTNIIYQIDNFNFSYPLSKYSIRINGNLNINQGDKILLTGSSGSGKSTLLMALKGLIPNYIKGKMDGKLLFNNIPIDQLSIIDSQRIGYLQQNPDHQIIYQKVIDELAFGLENQQLSKEQIKLQIINSAQAFGITHLLGRNFADLSGGEKQKVNLVAILLTSPQVLLLDEPTAFLDPDSAWQIIDILTQLSLDTTIIVIDHNQRYYKNFVNRIVNINQQKQIEELNLPTHIWHDSYPKLTKPNYSNQVILTINNLIYSYSNSNNILFNQLSLNLNQGEIAVIRGKNGMGKSTLFKIITKLIPSANNTLQFNNIDINLIKNKNYWQEVGLLWQNPEHHFLHNSVAEELEHNHELIHKYNLDEQSKNNPYCLSDGQKRRLSLAIALTRSCKLFLLDEPTFGQDYNNKLNLIDLINTLAQTGHSFLIISHDDEFSNTIAHTQYTLSDSKLWKK